jgi:small-conductance mechanosensitive channel
VIATIFDSAGDRIGEFLPRIGAALLVLVVGLIVVRLFARGLRRALVKLGVDRLAEKTGAADVLARGGLDRSLSLLVSAALRIALSIAVVLTALSISGLDVLQDPVDRAVLFLPQLLAALAIGFAGLVLAGWVRERADRMAFQMDIGGPIGGLAQAAVLAVTAIMVLAQLGISTQILTVLAAIAAGGAALALALAFGLGAREVARDISAGRYVSATYRVGQHVRVAGVDGEIVALESACTVLAGADGKTLRVPHHLFLREVVEATG